MTRNTTQPQSASSGFQGLGGGAYQQAFAKLSKFALLATIIAEGVRIVYNNEATSKKPASKKFPL